MSFDNFVRGFQGGLSTMQDYRKNEQLQELYDAAITEANAQFDAQDFDRVNKGLPTLKRSKTPKSLIGRLGGVLDPVYARWMEKLGRGTGATESPMASAIPVSGELTPPIQADPLDMQVEEIGFAGGTPGGVGAIWTEEELAKLEGRNPTPKAAAAPPKERPAPGSRYDESRVARGSPQTVEGDPKAYRPAREGQVGNAAKNAKNAFLSSTPPEGAGRLRRGINKPGGGGGALALGATALTTATTPTEQYRKRFGLETDDPSLLGDLGVRALGAASDLGNVLTLGAAGNFYRDLQGEPTPQAPPTKPQSALPTTAAAPAPAQSTPTAPARTAPAAPKQAVPDTAVEEDLLAGFDVSKIPAKDIPNFSNKDWEAHRNQMIDSLIMHGMSYAEAWDKVDQQVVQTQQRGFMHFAQQARALLAAGNKEAAASAVRAAFQYFPSTTDLEVTTYNGHVVGFPVDEDTGQQTGTPVVITPQLLDSVLTNFKNPDAWYEHAQDRRKLDQVDRGLGQKDRHLGILEQGLEIDRMNAGSNRLRAMGSLSDEGGLKPSDMDRHTDRFQGYAEMLVEEYEIDDPDFASDLASVMAATYQNSNGNDRPEAIIAQVRRLLKTEEGRARIKQLAQRVAGRHDTP